MPKRKNYEEKYKENVRKEQRILEEFAENEVWWAHYFFVWCEKRRYEPSEDEYRAAGFFNNKEFLKKPGSLTLLYYMDKRCYEELPDCTRENAFDLLRFKYRMYAEILKKGGYY